MDSASALIIHNEKILLFLRGNIPTIPNPNCWSCPGGHIEPGEDHLASIKRELSEEITHVPLKLIYIGARPVSSGTGVSHIYLSFVTDEEAVKFKIGSDEGQEIRFFTLDEALSLKLTPGVKVYFEKHQKHLRKIISERKFPANVKI